MESPFLMEITKLLKNDRKQIAETLGVSYPLLSQWTKGSELITEAHLATLINSLPINKDAKEAEFLRLALLLWQEKISRDTKLSTDKRRWKSESATFANDAFRKAIGIFSDKQPVTKANGLTLQDFPNSFLPLAIISGDRREDSGSRITLADVGAISPSHAEFRWLLSLGLDKSIEIYGDKMFVLESIEELQKRFGEKHLLVLGSPASNHLARRCLLDKRSRIKGWNAAAPIFRFNLPKFVLQNIESFISSVEGKKAKEIAAKQDDPETLNNMKTWLHYLFTGGILDPSHGRYWLRGYELPPHRDYGLVTLARNPFADPLGKPYMCIMVAGFHLFGTAHALKMLSMPEKAFQNHALGGVIKVDIDSGLKFATRFDQSTAEWDDGPEGYDVEQVRQGLNNMKTDLYSVLHITSEEIDECQDFLKVLLD